MSKAFLLIPTPLLPPHPYSTHSNLQGLMCGVPMMHASRDGLRVLSGSSCGVSAMVLLVLISMCTAAPVNQVRAPTWACAENDPTCETACFVVYCVNKGETTTTTIASSSSSPNASTTHTLDKAFVAVQTLRRTGLWRGHVLVVTDDEMRRFDPLVRLARVEVINIPSGGQRKWWLDHAGRVGEVFRFVPPKVNTVIILDPSVVVGTSVQTFVMKVAGLSQLRDGPEIWEFPTPGGTHVGFQKAVTVVYRLASQRCLRACQQAAPGRDQFPILDPRTSSVVCVPQALDPAWTDETAVVTLKNHRKTMFSVIPASLRFNNSCGELQCVTQPEVPEWLDFLERSHGLVQENLASFYASAAEPVSADAAQRIGAPPAPPPAIGTVASDGGKYGDGLEALDCIPHIALAGAAKCATTTLHEWLVTHPMILDPFDKEPNWNFDATNVYMVHKYARWLKYRDPNDGVSRLTIDSSTHLMWNMTKIRNLNKLCPNTKFIFVLCDPITRVVSHWNYRKAVWEWDAIKGKNLERAVLKELLDMPQWVKNGMWDVDPSVLDSLELDIDDGNGTWTLVRESLYALSLLQIASEIPPERMLVVNREEMNRDPHNLMARLEDYIGLEHYTYPDSLFTQRVNMNSEKKDQLGTQVQQMLENLFLPYNRLLEGMLGWNLSKWNKDACAQVRDANGRYSEVCDDAGIDRIFPKFAPDRSNVRAGQPIFPPRKFAPDQ